jgi:hypothetical protein
MNPRRTLQGIVFALLVGMFPLIAHARPRDSQTYGGMVNFGSQLLYLDEGCLSVDGTMTSGNFFENLKRNDNGILPEYRKSGELVTEYPDSLTASIRIIGNRCAAASGSHSPIFNGDSYSLSFGVAWKNGFELSPAVLSSTVVRCVGTSVLINPSGDGDIVTAPLLTCQLTVASKGIPLADHLIVSVFAADGKLLTRLSAAP